MNIKLFLLLSVSILLTNSFNYSMEELTKHGDKVPKFRVNIDTSALPDLTSPAADVSLLKKAYQDYLNQKKQALKRTKSKNNTGNSSNSNSGNNYEFLANILRQMQESLKISKMPVLSIVYNSFMKDQTNISDSRLILSGTATEATEEKSFLSRIGKKYLFGAALGAAAVGAGYKLYNMLKRSNNNLRDQANNTIAPEEQSVDSTIEEKPAVAESKKNAKIVPYGWRKYLKQLRKSFNEEQLQYEFTAKSDEIHNMIDIYIDLWNGNFEILVDKGLLKELHGILNESQNKLLYKALKKASIILDIEIESSDSYIPEDTTATKEPATTESTESTESNVEPKKDAQASAYDYKDYLAKLRNSLDQEQWDHIFFIENSKIYKMDNVLFDAWDGKFTFLRECGILDKMFNILDKFQRMLLKQAIVAYELSKKD